MNFAYVISFCAGLSTLLGSFVLFFKSLDKNKLISKSLAFASGVMISVSIFDLIPASIAGLNNKFYLIPSIILSFIFIVIGVILSFFINKCLPDYDKNIDAKLYRTGIFSMIAIILHNIPEGIVTFLTASENMNLGVSLALAIALHNIPEGISISVPIYFSTKNKFKSFFLTFISGISEFIGALIAAIFLSKINVNLFLDFLYSVIAGIMISLSWEELLPKAQLYNSKGNIIIYFLIGFIFMFFVHFLI